MQQRLAQNQLDFLRPMIVKAFALFGFSIDGRPTPEEVKERYRELAKKYHPDKGGDEDKMKEIIEAYELLIGKSKIKIPPPQRIKHQGIIWMRFGGYVYTGTSSTGTCATCW